MGMKTFNILKNIHNIYNSKQLYSLSSLSNRWNPNYILPNFSFVCVYSSNNKTFKNLENRAEILKDAIDHKREQIKHTEKIIRLRSVEIVRDIKHQKEVTSQKLREKKDGIIKDILETKTKVKEKIEEVVEKENVFTVPNILCVARIAMSPYLGYVILQDEYSLALGLLTLAGITDLLDGWIARTWKGQSSKMGSFLDPMADKVLIATLFICLTYQDLIPLGLTLLIVGRDAVLVAAGFIIRYISLPPPVGTTLASPVFGYVDHPALQALFGVTAVSTVISAVSYLTSKDTFKVLKKKL